MPFEDRLPCPVLWKMLRVTALLTATYGSQQALLLHFWSHSSDGKVWAKNIVLQKCWLASFKPGQPDWKTSFWVVFFLAHFLHQRLPSFSAPLSWWKWFYWYFHSLQNVSYFPRTLQYKYFPLRYVAVCAGGWGRYIWGSLSAPRDTLSKGPHLQCDSTVRVAVQHVGVTKQVGALVCLSCHLSVALHSWCCVTGSECLESGLQPAWAFQSVPHLTFMTQTSKKPKKLRLDVAYCFPIYILKREHAIPL